MALQPPVSALDQQYGNPEAAIELVEYGDFQCPHCGRAFPIVQRIQAIFGEDLKFVFRNFPLANIHPQAKIAAVAAEAAGLQGKYWEMHHLIFENQQQIFQRALLEYAAALNLQLPQFEADLDNALLISKVESDFESGLRSGVNGTPTFFVNGEKYNGNWEGDALINFLKLALEKIKS